jgi:hypothetical protein
MRRRNVVCLSLAGLAIALAAAGCGGSSAVTGPEETAPPAAKGSAVVLGTVAGSTAGLQVGVVGTPLLAPVDEEGQFALAGVPAGTATLRFEGAGVDARVAVPGVQDGLVTSVTVRVSGGAAELTGTPTCSPTAETYFSGTLYSVEGTRLVVGSRTVDASQVKKVWRGDRRIQLSELEVGEKVKVWGTQRGDGVVLAEEIAALTSGPSGSETWVTFSGKVESVSASARDVHGNPNGGYPVLVVAGNTVRTSSDTKVRRSDGSAMSPTEIKVGQTASVEGWRKTDGSVRATKIVVEGTGSGTPGDWVAFRGRVEAVAASDLAADVHSSCVLKMKVAGRYVQTDGSTVYKWSDGSVLDPYAIVAGDQAFVEGWSKPEGYVLAAKVVVDKR